MSFFSKWVLSLVNLMQSVRKQSLQWHSDNQAQQAELKRGRLMAERALEAELKKQSVLLEHELNRLMIRHDAELAMYKTRCKQDIKDYQHYLESLDQLKTSIQTAYSHLPESVGLTIHHHAKHLLHAMWEAEDYEQKICLELQLIRFMTAVHEDARAQLEEASPRNLPEGALNLIRQH